MARFFEDGVARSAGMHDWADVGGWGVDGDVGEGHDYVEMSEHPGELLEDWAIGG